MNTVHSFFTCFCFLSSALLAIRHHSTSCVSTSTSTMLKCWFEKASLQCRLNHSNRFWSARSNSSRCLVLLSFGMNESTFPCSSRRLYNIFVVFLKSSRFELGHATRISTPLRRPHCTLSRLHFYFLVTQSMATLERGFPGPHLRSSGTLALPKALAVSPHLGADGHVQGERGRPVP